MQLAGSVNTQIIANPAAAIIPIVAPVDANWFINVLGTPVDTQPNPFPTIPSTIKGRPVYTNHLYYPGLSASYIFNAGFGETPTHRQIQYMTQDIPSIQLTIRQGISPDVIARWQMAASQMGQPVTTGGS
jgi:hypothetical protein